MKARKKAQIDSQKELIRAEDREKGIYYLAGDKAVQIPRSAKQGALSAERHG